MPKFTQPPKLPELKMEKLKEQGEMEEMYSRFNQSVLLFRRQDQFLTRFHFLHDEAVQYDPSGISLAKCFSTLKHASLVLCHAFRKHRRESLDKKLKRWGDDYNKAFVSKFGGVRTIPDDKYGELHGRLFDICNIIYAAQQESGLGVVMERRATDLSKFNEALLGDGKD